MSSHRLVALIGLPPAERAFFATLFRTADDAHSHSYTVVDAPDKAEVLIVNADHADVVMQLAAAPPSKTSVILVGESRHGTQWPLLRRPLMFADVRTLIRGLESERITHSDFGPATIRAGILSGPAPLPSQATQNAPTAPMSPDETRKSTSRARPAAALPGKPPAASLSPRRSWDGMPMSAVAFEPDDNQGFAQTAIAEYHPASETSAVLNLAFGASQTAPESHPGVQTERPAVLPAPAMDAARPARAVARPPGRNATAHKPAAVATHPADATAIAADAAPRSRPATVAPSSGFGMDGSEAVAARADSADSSRSVGLPADAPPPGLSLHELPDILLVDRRRAEQVPLAAWLRRLGRRVALVQTQSQAESGLTRVPYRYVFLDEASIGDSVLKMARALGKQRNALGEKTRVVVVADHGGFFTRIRASLAGCDAWMTMPLHKRELLDYFESRDRTNAG